MTEVLVKAIFSDLVKVVTELLKYESVKSIINDPISIFNSQYFCLAFAKSAAMATVLLSNGARVDTIQQFKRNNSGISKRISDPLNIFVKQPAFAKLLIESYGASVDVYTIPNLRNTPKKRSLKSICNPLIFAVLMKQLQTLEIFLQHTSERRYFIGAIAFSISTNNFDALSLILSVFLIKFELNFADVSYFWEAVVRQLTSTQILKWLTQKTKEVICWEKYDENVVMEHKDIFGLIMSYLPQKDVLKMTSVCKSWMRTCRNCVLNEIKAKDEKSTISLFKRFPLVQSATIGGSFIYIEEWRSTLQSLKCANVIEELPAEKYDNLDTLNIETAPGISEQSIYQAFPNLKNLRHVRYCQSEYVEYPWKNLERLNLIFHTQNITILIQSTKLKSLCLDTNYSFPHVTFDDSIYQLQSLNLCSRMFSIDKLNMSKFTSLTHLALFGGYREFLPQNLPGAVAQIPCLKTLALIGPHLVDYNRLRLSSFKMPQLKELILIGSFETDLLNCDNLEYLVIHREYSNYYSAKLELTGNVLNTLKWCDYKYIKVHPRIGVDKPYRGPFEISKVVLYNKV